MSRYSNLNVAQPSIRAHYHGFSASGRSKSKGQRSVIVSVCVCSVDRKSLFWPAEKKNVCASYVRLIGWNFMRVSYWNTVDYSTLNPILISYIFWPHIAGGQISSECPDSSNLNRCRIVLFFDRHFVPWMEEITMLCLAHLRASFCWSREWHMPSLEQSLSVRLHDIYKNSVVAAVEQHVPVK